MPPRIITLTSPTPGIEFGTPADPTACGRSIILFSGIRGRITRDPVLPAWCRVFTVEQSGARYLVDLDYVKFEACDTTGEFAPTPGEL